MIYPSSFSNTKDELNIDGQIYLLILFIVVPFYELLWPDIFHVIIKSYIIS